MKAKNKGKISYALQTITILPLLLFGLIILGVGTHLFTKSMNSEVEIELNNVSSNLVTMFDALYPGDYRLESGTALHLYKGEHDLAADYDLIDCIKEDTGMEITLFYQDTRVLTTITDENGQRIIGSAAPSEVTKEVLENGNPKFYKKTLIHGSNYFSYYIPLRNQDGTVMGMLFVGKPTAEVDAFVRRSLYPLLLVDIVLVILVSLLTFFYTKRFAAVLLQIHGFLKNVSAGNLNAELSPSVLNRRDELGEIGQSALTMQRSLYTLIEQDALTGLCNRRSGDKKLRQVMEASAAAGTPFCVAIGDIDFFKKVNDTYGHDCGDMVLQNIAAILRRHMQSIGTAARWGGEEFLLIFENRKLDAALESLNQLMENIRAAEYCYGGQAVKVTMTFGIAPGDARDAGKNLRIADEKLYEGKTAGRNRIVS